MEVSGKLCHKPSVDDDGPQRKMDLTNKLSSQDDLTESDDDAWTQILEAR